MTRRTYSVLAIARRHPRLMSALARPRTWPELAGLNPAALSCAPERITAAGDGSLRGLTDADLARVVRGEPYTWPMVPWRTDAPQRRRSEPRASRFGDLR